MSFDTMMASATVSTITMAVAADRPPTNASDGEDARSGLQRQRQHEHVAVDLAGREGQQAGDRDRHHEQVDQHEIDREHPARALDLALVVVLDHGDVELPRQQQDRDERQQRHRQQRVERRLAGQHRGGRRRIHRLAEQRDRPVEHPEGDEDADRQERQQLDDRFGGDRQHQAVLMLGRVDVPGAEQHREHRHRQRDEQRHVAEQRPARCSAAGMAWAMMVSSEDDTALSCSAM